MTDKEDFLNDTDEGRQFFYALKKSQGDREPSPAENMKMKEMFLGAIRIQEEIIEDAKRRIGHYLWAIDEMAKQDDAAMKIVDVDVVVG